MGDFGLKFTRKTQKVRMSQRESNGFVSNFAVRPGYRDRFIADILSPLTS